MAVDGLAKGRQYTSKTKLGQQWIMVWDEYEICVRHGINMTVLKVKSHETDIEKVPKYYKMAKIVPIITLDKRL